MSWRTVVITNRCKLDYKMGYMVIRGEETKRIFLDEVVSVIIENPAVSLTGCLLSVLTEKKIKVIFCDEKRNPSSELVPIYGCYDCSSKIRQQISWDEEIKGAVWTAIISEKIANQAKLLLETGRINQAQLLNTYIEQIEFYDATNREGHAAKVYFNALFGKDFSRNKDCDINAALDYSYAVLLSAVNREVVACGYLTQLGIFHENTFNFFNHSCDLMEPVRIFFDRFIVESDFMLFDSQVKLGIISLLHQEFIIDSKNQTLLNAIKIYVRSVFDALNSKDIKLIKFPEYEL